jgi:prevent-host-death family protein
MAGATFSHVAWVAPVRQLSWRVLKMMIYICYTTSMTDVKIAYAKAHLAELLARVARGERIVISRYNTPMAELVPPPTAEKAQRRFGTGKGKAMLIAPRALDAMTDEEADAFLEGR